MRPRVWFLDLDDTLHHASHAIFAAIDLRMTDFVERHLGVGRDEADRLRRDYWQRYGATLIGMVRHHGVDAGRFLHETHDFDVAALLRVERGLHRLGRALPGRKLLLTNSPDRYARDVLRGIGLHRELRRRYSIEDQRLHGQWRPKPSVAMLRALLAREGLPNGRALGRRAVLVDDNRDNLRAAYRAGLATVLVQMRDDLLPGGMGRRLRGGAYLCGRLRSVRRLPALAARLRANRPGATGHLPG
jgi:putative hydrolase of the HAD superfamily